MFIEVGITMDIGGTLRCPKLINLSVDNIRDEEAVITANVQDTKTNIDKSFYIVNPKDKSSLNLTGR
mgnify:CR=1 FL=1